MGYFPNGTSGLCYQEKYCDKCAHDVKQDCAVWLAHLLHNYDDCNNPESILHILIPRSKDGDNEKCKMFMPLKEAQEDEDIRQRYFEPMENTKP